MSASEGMSVESVVASIPTATAVTAELNDTVSGGEATCIPEILQSVDLDVLLSKFLPLLTSELRQRDADGNVIMREGGDDEDGDDKIKERVPVPVPQIHSSGLRPLLSWRTIAREQAGTATNKKKAKSVQTAKAKNTLHYARVLNSEDRKVFGQTLLQEVYNLRQCHYCDRVVRSEFFERHVELCPQKYFFADDVAEEKRLNSVDDFERLAVKEPVPDSKAATTQQRDTLMWAPYPSICRPVVLGIPNPRASVHAKTSSNAGPLACHQYVRRSSYAHLLGRVPRGFHGVRTTVPLPSVVPAAHMARSTVLPKSKASEETAVNFPTVVPHARISKRQSVLEWNIRSTPFDQMLQPKPPPPGIPALAAARTASATGASTPASPARGGTPVSESGSVTSSLNRSGSASRFPPSPAQGGTPSRKTASPQSVASSTKKTPTAKSAPPSRPGSASSKASSTGGSSKKATAAQRKRAAPSASPTPASAKKQKTSASPAPTAAAAGKPPVMINPAAGVPFVSQTAANLAAAAAAQKGASPYGGNFASPGTKGAPPKTAQRPTPKASPMKGTPKKMTTTPKSGTKASPRQPPQTKPVTPRKSTLDMINAIASGQNVSKVYVAKPGGRGVEDAVLSAARSNSSGASSGVAGRFPSPGAAGISSISLGKGSASSTAAINKMLNSSPSAAARAPLGPNAQRSMPPMTRPVTYSQPAANGQPQPQVSQPPQQQQGARPGVPVQNRPRPVQNRPPQSLPTLPPSQKQQYPPNGPTVDLTKTGNGSGQ